MALVMVLPMRCVDLTLSSFQRCSQIANGWYCAELFTLMTPYYCCVTYMNHQLKRVVVTSSVVSVYGNADDKGDGHVYTDEDWNETSTLADNPYPLSKVTAEKEAWKLAKAQSQYTMATVNPGLVLGPV